MTGVSAADHAAVQSAAQHVQAGRFAAAAAALQTLSPAARRQPDVLYLGAICADKGGRPAEALALFDAALAIAPGNAGIWNSRGNLLYRTGAADAAIASYRRAVSLAPGHFEAWLNLGNLARTTAQDDLAADALARARRIAPHDSRVPAAIGLLEQQRGRPAAAVAAFEAALAGNPRDGRTRHNLATALRSLGDSARALAEIETAMRDGANAPETATVRAHLLAELGQFDAAVAQYRRVIAAAPEHIDAQETLALLLPQVGRREEALAGYSAALAAGAGRDLWQSAIRTARALGEAAVMLDWADAAIAAHGPQPDWIVARIAALTLLGDDSAAVAAGLAADQGLAGVRTHLAYLYLRMGDPVAAERHALAATQIAPEAQTGWALLTIIWRLTGDRRERWLADYDRLVMVADLIEPPGWRDLSDFMTAVATSLTRLHVTQLAPAEQSLRGGTQTRGQLFQTADPVLIALQESLIATVRQCLSGLTPDPGHPFLGRLADGIAMAGSWSVRLAGQGFHISHIHPAGWLSSAFYVAVPPEVAAGDGCGALLFGVPDAALGIDLPPRRVVTPQSGRLAIFPSYFWHGTAPFESVEPRLTVAFDALPNGAHRS